MKSDLAVGLIDQAIRSIDSLQPYLSPYYVNFEWRIGLRAAAGRCLASRPTRAYQEGVMNMPLDVSLLRSDTPGAANVLHVNNADATLPPRPVLDAVMSH